MITTLINLILCEYAKWRVEILYTWDSYVVVADRNCNVDVQFATNMAVDYCKFMIKSKIIKGRKKNNESPPTQYEKLCLLIRYIEYT